MNNKNIIKKHIFKAIYKRKYIGLFYINKNKVALANIYDANDFIIKNVLDCKIFFCSRFVDKNGSILFENDLVVDNDGRLGRVMFENGRFIVKYHDFTKSLTNAYRKKIEVIGDAILDKNYSIAEIDHNQKRTICPVSVSRG